MGARWWLMNREWIGILMQFASVWLETLRKIMKGFWMSSLWAENQTWYFMITMQLRYNLRSHNMAESKVLQNRKGSDNVSSFYDIAPTFTGLGYAKTGLLVNVVMETVHFCPGIQIGWNNTKFTTFHPSQDIVQFCRNFRPLFFSMAFTFLTLFFYG